ncbi:MAG: dethiobiotin synthase [Lachnospiraceae bacterium]|nr:dethiobiotin synthase [Lachnospiraceae bacterium]
MSKGIFITGTNTDVGKTYVTGLIVKKLKEEGMNIAYYKAAMSGNLKDEKENLIPGDAVMVKQMSGISQPVESMCPYVYENAWSPHLASRVEGNPVNMDVIKKGFESLGRQYDYVIMEGSGGILCPIRFDDEKIWLEDIIKEFDLPCIIIADAGLGTINHVVLTVEYMRSKKIEMKGLIFNHYHKGNLMEEDNIKMCEDRTGLKGIACVADHDTEIQLRPDTLQELLNEQHD